MVIFKYTNINLKDIGRKNLHSNLVIFKYYIENTIVNLINLFTFQYGDIQIQTVNPEKV